MTEEQLKKLHTAMQNDNEHQCNKLYNYIHTDVFLTAEVVQVVREIVAEETKELQEENLKLEAQIEKMKSDVVRCFGDEFNILVAKLLKEWEIKEK